MPDAGGADSRSTDDAEFSREYAVRQLARRQHPLRRAVKRLYLDNLLRFVNGRTLDVGCGAGQLLERLPTGSVGIEVNPALVAHLNGCGLDVRAARADGERIDLSAVAAERFETLVLSHVLEHFDHADRVLADVLHGASTLSANTVVVVVPGWVGYRSDPTHKTFVTIDYIRQTGLDACAGFELQETSFYPGNAAWLGRLFVYHELLLVYRRTATAT